MDLSLKNKSSLVPEGTMFCKNQLKVIEKIGQGTYGEVYKVERVKDGKLYAAKF